MEPPFKEQTKTTRWIHMKPALEGWPSVTPAQAKQSQDGLSAFPERQAYARSLTSVEPQFFLTESMPFLAADSEEYISLLPITC